MLGHAPMPRQCASRRCSAPPSRAGVPGTRPLAPRERRRGATLAAAAAGGGSGSGGADDGPAYTSDEAAAYAEVLAAKRAAKEAALAEVRRKRSFNPLHAKLRVSPADGDDGGDGAPAPPARPRPGGAAFAARPPGAMLAELLAGGEDDIPDVTPLTVKAERRRSPAQLKAAAAARRADGARVQRALRAAQLGAAADGPVAQPRYRRPGAAPPPPRPGAGLPGLLAAAAAADEGEEEEDGGADGGDDELDWDALGQYEQLERYVDGLNRPQPPARRAPSGAPPAAAAAPPALVPPAPTTRAPAAPRPPSGAPPAAPGAGAPASRAAAAAPPGGKQQRRVKRSERVARMEKDLDELEQMVGLLEALEAGGGGAPARQQAGGAGAAAGAAAGGADAAGAADPGEALLKALLGADWEAELLDDLASAVDDEDEDANGGAGGVGEAGAAAGARAPAGAAAAAGGAADGEEAPWADDITGLLLGLVTISHQKYLQAPLPLPGGVASVPEEGRCAAFWGAPWALLVVDDSREACVEYVNAAAADMLGGTYLDLFGRPAHEAVAPGMAAQADWAYAARKVEESAAACATLPALELRGAIGRAVLARDVTLWRVDSLEDTPVGMAVLVRSWEPAPAAAAE
ncbi:hypothetical protein HT031_002653 [Scenedesmus sp. PABB004]|nr:hypothetical protein HT031_002653 [Scenedesmus sp. PABB004]